MVVFVLAQLSLDPRAGELGAFQQATIVFMQGRQCFNIVRVGSMRLPNTRLPLGIQLGDMRPMALVSRIEHLRGNIQRLPQGRVRGATHPSFAFG
jgi:hypothetical protein